MEKLAVTRSTIKKLSMSLNRMQENKQLYQMDTWNEVSSR